MSEMFRALRADEIDARVAQCKQKGVQLLLYKNARCDMNILDETVGPMNWMRRHVRENANCIVSIYDKDRKQWIEKEDTGTESNTEAEKGLASDSFKRACVNWGIGRELYTAPFIWIKAGDVTLKEGTYNNKPTYKTYDTFSVEEMDVKDGQIIAVTIRNDTTGKRVFTWKKPAPNQSPADVQPKPDEAMKPDAKAARNNAWTALATALGKTNKEMSACVNSLIQANLAPNKPLAEYTDSEYGKLLDGIAANFRAAGDDAA